MAYTTVFGPSPLNRMTFPPTSRWTHVEAALPAVAYANSVTRILVGSGAITGLPANTLNVGSTIEYQASGQYSVAAATTPTLTFGIATGTSGQTDFTTVVQTTGSGVTGISWTLYGTITILTVGSSGTMIGFLQFNATDTTKTLVSSPVATAAIDTTAVHTPAISMTWGAASAANTCTVGTAYLRVF